MKWALRYLALFLGVAALSAQQPSFKVDVRLVRLLVTVKNAAGDLVGLLNRADFTDSGRRPAPENMIANVDKNPEHAQVSWIKTSVSADPCRLVCHVESSPPIPRSTSDSHILASKCSPGQGICLRLPPALCGNEEEAHKDTFMSTRGERQFQNTHMQTGGVEFEHLRPLRAATLLLSRRQLS